MTIQQAIMAAKEIDKQQQEVLNALAEYATESPMGLGELQVDENEIAKYKQSILNGYVSLAWYVNDILAETLTPEEKEFIDWIDVNDLTIGHDMGGYYVAENDATNLTDMCLQRAKNFEGIISIASYKYPTCEISHLLERKHNIDLGRIVTFLSSR